MSVEKYCINEQLFHNKEVKNKLFSFARMKNKNLHFIENSTINKGRILNIVTDNGRGENGDFLIFDGENFLIEKINGK